MLDGRTTLDDLLRSSAARNPDRLALIDAPHRSDVIGGPLRRMTYAEVDNAVTALALQFCDLGLPPGSVVALQLPNCVEGVLTMMAVLRAGMTASPLPLLWREAEAVPALRRIAAKAIVTTARAGASVHAGLAMRMAAEAFTVRHVCAFGEELPDGVIGLDAALTCPAIVTPPATFAHPPARAAVLTWETGSKDAIAVGRDHRALIAGGLAVTRTAEISEGAKLLTTCPPGSFAGLAVGPIAWLLTGGTLALHQPFDRLAFGAQCRIDDCDTVIVPATLAPALARAELLGHAALRTVIALWRAPERMAAGTPLKHDSAKIVDLAAFGELGLVAMRREGAFPPGTLRFGDAATPGSTACDVGLIEGARSDLGTLALRGTMAPDAALAADLCEGAGLAFGPDGWIDTNYPCQTGEPSGTLRLTGARPGVVGVGSYRFLPCDIEATTQRTHGTVRIAVLPDSLLGQRLAGVAADPAQAMAELTAAGLNPLLADALRERRPAAAGHGADAPR